MFTIFETSEQKYPIKVWLENPGQLEADCLQQAKNLANLPFLHQWVALMPDTHSGYGMPIGGVIAAKDVIIPNAVGVDIGCGMTFVQTDIPIKPLMETGTANGKLAQAIVGDILRNLPTGFEHHRERQECESISRFLLELENEGKAAKPPALMKELENGYYQIGTLGGGNHFVELQADEQGFLGIMVHSGSRNVGYKICHFFNEEAREINRSADSPIPEKWNLAYLTTDSESGRAYIRWMDFAMEFAKENRDRMMQMVTESVRELVGRHAGIKAVHYNEPISCHHNYAALEEHYGERVWVHRKGAIRAGKGEMGIIPGAMGSTSFLVRGKGNPESFASCSHGAGRRMSRSAAKAQFPMEETIHDLKTLGVFLGKRRKHDVGEESRFAYKDIDFVIANELDLIEPLKKLRTLAVIKG